MKIAGIILVTIFLLFAVILFILLLLYGFDLASALVSGAKELEPTIYVPLSITVLTAIFGLTATLYTQRRTRLREIESAHRDRKLEIYFEFLKFIEIAMISSKPELGGKPLDKNELARKLVEFRTKAVLWGSLGVLKSVAKLTSGKPSGTLEVFDTLEKIQREMRKDIGLSNFGLEKGFFAKLPLSDPSELERMRAKQE